MVDAENQAGPKLPPTIRLDADGTQERTPSTRTAESRGTGALGHVELQPGDRLGNRYEIRSLISKGGMGAVYVARDSLRNAEIALKVMLPALFEDADARQRFLDEATRTSSLRHDNLIHVFDAQIDGTRIFLTMELLEGETLRARTKRWHKEQYRCGLEEALAIARPMFEALHYAHRKGVVHRDIKPENVFLCRNGDIKVMDFGIARFGKDPHLTEQGQVMGTLRFMAPEQAIGDLDIDHRADQYAAGLVMCEVFGIDLPAARKRKPAETRPDLPASALAAVERATERNRDDRHADMMAFLGALAGAGARGGNPTNRRALVAGAVLVFGAAAWGGIAFATNRWPFESRVVPPSPDAGSARTSASPPAAEDPAAAKPSGAATSGREKSVALVDSKPKDAAGVTPDPQGSGKPTDPGNPPDVDAVDSEGLTPFEKSLLAKDGPRALDLSRRGARLDFRGRKDRMNALHLAATGADEGFFQSLVDRPDAKAFLDAGDVNGDTPLMLAGKNCALGAWRHLLAAGANRTKKNAAGFTALHALARASGPLCNLANKRTMVDLLLAGVSKPEAKQLLDAESDNSRTAAEIARKEGEPAFAHYLESKRKELD